MGQFDNQDFLRGKLKTMMGLRLLMVLVFLIITIWIQLWEPASSYTSFYAIYVFAVTIFFITFIYAVLFKSLSNLTRFAYIQVAVDIALISVVVYMSGGIASYLSILYYLSVIGSGIIAGRRGAFYSATLAVIAYTFIIYMDLQGVLPQAYRFQIPTKVVWIDAVTTVLTNVAALYSVALLVGYITERTVRVERELEEKVLDLENLASLNKEIVENINSGIMTLDKQGRITSFNKGAEDISGYKLGEVYRLKAGEVFDIFSQESLDAIAPGMRGEEKIMDRSNTEKYLGFTVSSGKGGDMHRVVIFQNLTELKSMEAQLRRDDKLKALGELSAGLAHEIRNPLASISGSIQVLRDELDLTGPDEHLMEIVLRETERLNALITDFLLFARPQQKDSSVFDICKVINDTLSVFRNSPEASSINIRCRLDGEAYVEGNSRQVGQVFWNLFLNASQAMREGGALSVSMRHLSSTLQRDATPRGHNSVEITVSDTGSGIDNEEISRIFDPFYSTKDSGTGLGLAIVHRIVTSLGGSIDASSKKGQGITFKLTFPELKSGGVSSMNKYAMK